MTNHKHIDFLGVGTQKSGTSWLHYNLGQIQEFDLPPIKEIHYFDRNTDYATPNKLSETFLSSRIRQKKYLLEAIKNIGISILRLNLKLFRFNTNYYLSNYSDKWYLSLFKYFKGYTGEITPSYSILNEEDIRRIHKLLPDVKLVLMLRNPIERAWSQYRFSKRKIDNFDFKKIDHNEVIEFMESKGQSLRSDYIRTIESYSNIFSKEQLLICFFDAISDTPEILMGNILNHICGKTTISISNLNLKKVVHKSRKSDIPKEIEDYLKNKYHDQIKELSEKYGGYFTKWYNESYLEKYTIENTMLIPAIYIKS